MQQAVDLDPDNEELAVLAREVTSFCKGALDRLPLTARAQAMVECPREA